MSSQEQPSPKRTRTTPPVSPSSADALKAIQAKIEELDAQQAAQILEVQRQFATQRNELLQQRAELIARVPHFWARAFSHDQLISDLLTSTDHDILHHLQDLRVVDNDDPSSGYTLVFDFATPNPFFTNDRLTVDVSISPSSGLVRVTGSPVDVITPQTSTSSSSSSSSTTTTTTTTKRPRSSSQSSPLAASALLSWIHNAKGDDDALDLAELIHSSVFPHATRFLDA